jgi:hypothetical protein
MAVGTASLTFYENENIAPRFEVIDDRVTDVTGWTATFVIKETAADRDPPLHTADATVIGLAPTLILEVATQLPTTLVPGSYIYSLRRTNVGYDWQLAQGVLTVLDSASKDTGPGA